MALYQSFRTAMTRLPFGISLAMRICFSTLLILVTTLASYVVLYQSQRQQAQITQSILNERLQSLEAARELKESVISYDNAIFRYVATKSEDELVQLKKLRKRAMSKLDQLEVLNDRAIIRNRITRLRTDLKRYFADAANLVDVARSNQLPTKVGLFQAARWARSQKERGEELSTLSSEGSARIRRVLLQSDEVLAYNKSLVSMAKLELEQTRKESEHLAKRVLYGAFGLVLFVSMFLAVTLIGPLRILMKGVRQIEEGHLNVDLPVRTSTEFGTLLAAFNRMAKTIQMQRERLVKEAITDSLTGAYNQGYLTRRLSEEFDRSKRRREPLSLMMIDVDHFKEYNDTKGHEMGNVALRKIADLIREHVRSSDVLFRYGGDEFAIILPAADAEAADMIASRLIEAINKNVAPLSLSIGGATYPHHAVQLDDLKKKADDMLYIAKSRGRNCFCWCKDVVSEAA